MHAHFVYILHSLSGGTFYIGQTDHLLRRFHEHAVGKHRGTRGRGPWWMPYWEAYPTRIAAMQRERQLKGWKSAERIRALIARELAGLDLG